jgi:transposase-like protein
MTERERDRHAAHRLAIIRHAQELTGNVSKTCRYYGISRQVYYKWLRRYEDGGLEALRDRSSRPHVSPKATRVEVVGKIIYLRQTYHFGPHKLANAVENPSVGSTPLLAQSAAISCESRGLLIQVFVVGSGKGPPRGGPFPRVADCSCAARAVSEQRSGLCSRRHSRSSQRTRRIG